MAEPDVRTFPATSGTLIGWIGLVTCGLLGATALVQEHSIVGVRWAIITVLVALVIYAFMLRPKVRVSREEIVLVNAYDDTYVPFGAVTGFEVRQFTSVYVGQTRYVAVGIGRPIRQLVGGQDRAPGSPPGLGRLSRSGGDLPTSGRNLTIDLLEDRVRSGRSDALLRGDDAGPVRRTRPWWLIGATAAVAVVLAVSFLF